ncbi:hypothetical protein Salat_0831700 [Sesamum alatum]|uniref:Uncharacterized protein n=1 Tax=Sesamum alatum TaxID=300844 RepID=A0AAE2CQE0_9LAMI|nr:hypothetical protein Salat_0831700 [Sesamum alatum]
MDLKGPKTLATQTRLLWPNRHTGSVDNKTSQRPLSITDFTKNIVHKGLQRHQRGCSQRTQSETARREEERKEEDLKLILEERGVFIEKKKKKSLDEGINSGDIGKRPADSRKIEERDEKAPLKMKEEETLWFQ